MPRFLPSVRYDPRVHRPTRLSWIRATFLALLAVALAGSGARRAERPISAQLHLHGPFSEGLGSIDSHSFEASALGVEVV